MKRPEKPLNNNLLDYKIPTAMDAPELHVEFIQLDDPTGPYGNKSLGERRQFRLLRRSGTPSFMQRRTYEYSAYDSPASDRSV